MSKSQKTKRPKTQPSRALKPAKKINAKSATHVKHKEKHSINGKQEQKQAPSKETKKDTVVKQKKNPAIMPPDVVKAEIDRLIGNSSATEYLRKNVSKTSIDIISLLVTPKTDEFLSEQLGMKINAVRRVLNIMQGYGITNYYVSKNTKGWLSFAWYINTSKLAPFLDHVLELERDKVLIDNDCNDYFVCGNCYETDKLLYTFDAAFESGFKCSCGKNLARIEKSQAESMYSQ